MNISERLPMQILESNARNCKKKRVSLNYINKNGISFVETDEINNRIVNHGDFIVDEPINMIDSNGVILTNIKGIIDDKILNSVLNVMELKKYLSLDLE